MLRYRIVFWSIVGLLLAISLWSFSAADSLRPIGRGIVAGVPFAFAVGLLTVRCGQALNVKRARNRVNSGIARWTGMSKAVADGSSNFSPVGGWASFDDEAFTFDGEEVRLNGPYRVVRTPAKLKLPIEQVITAQCDSRRDFMGRGIDRLELRSATWSGTFDVLDPAGELPDKIKRLIHDSTA